MQSWKFDLDSFEKGKGTKVGIRFLDYIIAVLDMSGNGSTVFAHGISQSRNSTLLYLKILKLDFNAYPKGKGIKTVISFAVIDTRMRAGTKLQYLR